MVIGNGISIQTDFIDDLPIGIALLFVVLQGFSNIDDGEYHILNMFKGTSCKYLKLQPPVEAKAELDQRMEAIVTKMDSTS